MITPRPHLRRGAIRWATLVFLVVFTVLLIVVTSYVLVPGFEAIKDPALTPEEKRSLLAWYRLLLFVLLFILFAGLVLTFRFGRFFFPRATAPRTQDAIRRRLGGVRRGGCRCRRGRDGRDEATRQNAPKPEPDALRSRPWIISTHHPGAPLDGFPVDRPYHPAS